MFTDIVGYTKLMGEDQAKALELLRKNRKIQKTLIEQHGGQHLKEMGDGILAQFNSAYDSVRCAVDIQNTIKEADFAGQIRIGIHLGDVTIELSDVFGDGVNIASRLQSIANPGGIFISDSVQQAIRGNKDLDTRYLGELELKNVDYAVKAYAMVEDYPMESRSWKHHLNRFTTELSNRNVLRASLLYIILSFLVIPLSNIIFPVLNFSESAYPILNICLGLGFLVSIYLAWNYEWSPKGFIKIVSQPSWQNPYTSARKKPLTHNLIIAVLLLTVVLLYFFPQSLGPGTDKTNKSIAVLYFDNMSGDSNQEYFSDGITEEIISHLSRIKDLRVVSRTSVLPYKDRITNINNIARELNVKTIMEGSVRKSGNRVIITAHLVDANNNVIWTHDFNEELQDIFEIQSTVARTIAEKLKIEISPEAEAQIRQQPTASIEAYDLYLQARALAFKNWGVGIGSNISNREKAIVLINEALQLDPGYSQALALIADIYRWYSTYLPGKDDLLDSTFILAKSAIDNHPQVAEGYIALGRAIEIRHGIDSALNWYRQAFEIDPFLGLISIGESYYRNGNYPIALWYFSQKISLYPKQLDGYLHKALAYSKLGVIDSVEKYLNIAKMIDPDAREVFEREYQIYQFRGDTELTLKAATEYFDNDSIGFNRAMGIASIFGSDWEKAEEYYGNTSYRDMDIGLILWKTGRQDSAMTFLQEAIDYRMSVSHFNEWTAFDLSRIHALMGEDAKALNFLRLAVDKGWHDYTWFHNDPYLMEIKDTEDFKDIADDLDQKNQQMLEKIKTESNKPLIKNS